MQQDSNLRDIHTPTNLEKKIQNRPPICRLHTIFPFENNTNRKEKKQKYIKHQLAHNAHPQNLPNKL